MKWFRSASVAFLASALVAGALAQDTNTANVETQKQHGVIINIDTEKPSFPKDVTDKLTPDQIFELEKIKAMHPDEVPTMAPVIVAIVFGCPVAIVAVVLFFRQRRNQALHRTLAAMIEKGVPIPPELLQPETPPQKPPRNDLQGGVILIGVGLGLILFLLFLPNRAWGVGFIPLFMGIGRLIAWKLAKKNGNG
jgi:hypothetical protein